MTETTTWADWPPHEPITLTDLIAEARAVDWNFTYWCYASGHDASDPDARNMFECLLAYARLERGPRWIELTRSAEPRRPFSHPSSVPEPLLVANVRWRLDWILRRGSNDKCLAQSEKSRTEGQSD